ncbi:hypothetical protein ACWO25_004540 [Vibrio parahaemolyticus]
MTIIIDHHVWPFILTSYLYVLSFSCLAVAVNIGITKRKIYRFGNQLVLVGLSTLLIYHLLHPSMKEDLMISPLFGVFLFYIFLFSEPQQNKTCIHQVVRYALVGCAFTLFLFGALLLTA